MIVFKVNSKLLPKSIENNLRKAVGFAAEEGAKEGAKEGGDTAAGAEKVYIEEKYLDINDRVEKITTLLQRKEWGQALMRIRKLLDEAEYQNALYPEDGTTRDTLLNAADAAMYVAKQTRRHVDNLLAGQQNAETNFNDCG